MLFCLAQAFGVIGGGTALAFVSGVAGQTLGLGGLAPALGGLGLVGQDQVW